MAAQRAELKRRWEGLDKQRAVLGGRKVQAHGTLLVVGGSEALRGGQARVAAWKKEQELKHG